MFAQIHSPDFLEPFELDAYLAKGWFRMGQDIFTCNVLHFKRIFYSSIWLRIPLGDYHNDKAFQRLQKLNAGFQIKIQTGEITAEKEILYTKYKTGISFSTADSLVDLLLNNQQEPSIFDTYEVCMYDGEKLIAVGFFDLGEKSAAGIVSFYDPEYKKYSLGKFLIYKKVSYCKEKGLEYFYPGYFAPNYPMFDYKLEIGKSVLEFYDIYTSAWQPLSSFDNYPIPIYEQSHKLTEMEFGLQFAGFKTIRLKYEFYNANNIPRFRNIELFDYPEFIFVISNKFNQFAPILVFDVLLQKYRLLKCVSCFFDQNYVSTNGYYGAHLLKIDVEIFVTEEVEAMVNFYLNENEVKA